MTPSYKSMNTHCVQCAGVTVKYDVMSDSNPIKGPLRAT